MRRDKLPKIKRQPFAHRGYIREISLLDMLEGVHSPRFGRMHQCGSGTKVQIKAETKGLSSFL